MGRKKISRSKVRELHEKGFTDHEIAKELDCAQITIWEIRKELNLKSNRFSWRTIDHGELWKDYWGGMSLGELAVKYGYGSVSAVKCAIGRIYLERKRSHER